jgi:[ribosomal protein S5]-alanine N-acetyltransferase
VTTGGVLPAGRTRLQPLRPGDEAFWIALYTDPVAMAQVMPPLAPDAARRRFDAALRCEADAPPRRRTWVQRRLADDAAVGLLGLVFGADREAELGAVIAPAFQAAGHASEGIAALAAHAFGGLGLRRVHTRHRDGHGAAAALMRRTGFACTASGPDGWTWERRAPVAARVPDPLR